MHDDMKPQALPEPDHEGQMAKSELYRAAKHSMKLFQMIQDGQQLEGWVQGKITMAADYLDTVYHYMEYQMKFGDGEQAAHIDDITGDAEGEESLEEPIDDMEDEEKLAESYEDKLQALLEGKVKEAKIEKSGVRATDKKKGKVEKTEKKIYFVKLEKEGKTKGVTTQAEEGEKQQEVKDRVKRENMGWTVASIREKDSIDEASDIIAEKKKPSAGMTAKEKSAVVKKAKAGGDIGKPGKGFEKVEKAAKASGAKDPKAVAAAAMWKTAAKKTEESLVKSVVKKVVEAKKKKPDDDNDGVPNWADKKPGEDDNAGKGSKPKKGQVPPQFAKKKETVKESAELDRMKQFMKRLNG